MVGLIGVMMTIVVVVAETMMMRIYDGTKRWIAYFMDVVILYAL
jgi:hypothetical protein